MPVLLLRCGLSGSVRAGGCCRTIDAHTGVYQHNTSNVCASPFSTCHPYLLAATKAVLQCGAEGNSACCLLHRESTFLNYSDLPRRERAPGTAGRGWDGYAGTVFEMWARSTLRRAILPDLRRRGTRGSPAAGDRIAAHTAEAAEPLYDRASPGSRRAERRLPRD